MTDEKNISLEENHLIAERRTKLSAIRQRGNAFPNNFRPDSFTDALQTELGAKTKEELEALHRTASVAGRICIMMAFMPFCLCISSSLMNWIFCSSLLMVGFSG